MRTTNQRPIILVGHDIQNDMRAVERAGYIIHHHAPVEAVLDTQDIAREVFRGTRSLGDLCCKLGIKAKNLHNSGNDATYTLLALLKMGTAIVGQKEESDCGVRELVKKIANLCLQSKEENGGKTQKCNKSPTSSSEDDVYTPEFYY